MTRAWTRSWAACCVRKGLIFLMLCNANLQTRAVFVMCSLKGSWSSKMTSRFLSELDGVIVAESIWKVKSCCSVVVAGKQGANRSIELQVMFFHPCRDICQAAKDACSYRFIIWSKWEIELYVISIAMVGDTMCLYDGTQWCSVCGEEEEGSKNRSLRNPSDQLMCFGYLPAPGHPERPTSEIGFKPAKSLWCPVMRGWTGGSDD